MHDRTSGSPRVARYAGAIFAALLAAILAAPPYSETADAQTSGSDVTFVWAEQFGTSAADGARSVAVDPGDGSPIVAGYTSGTIDPQGSPPGSPLNIQPNLSAGGSDAYVRKHSRDGDWEWTRQFGSSLSDDAFDTATDRQGNTYVAGYGNPANRSQAGAFVAKYTPDGRLATLKDSSGNDAPWIRQFSAGRIWTFALDPEGNPYIAVSINSDVYMYKLNPQGGFEASEPFGAYGCYGSGLLDVAFGSAVGRSNDPSVYVTGLTSGQEIDDPNNCEVSTGEDELFLIKFDGNLDKKWDKPVQFGSSPGSGNALGVAVDSADAAYVVGYTSGVIRDPELAGEENKGGRDSFVVKIDEQANPETGVLSPRIEWTEQFGTTGNDLARDVAIDEADNIYVRGSTDGSFSANPNAGGTDGFLGKYDTNGNELVVRQFGSAGTDSPQGVAYDAVTDSVLVAGNTNGALAGQRDAGRTDFDGFLVKVRAQNLDGGPPPPPPGSEPDKVPLIFVPGAAGTQLLYSKEFDECPVRPTPDAPVTCTSEDQMVPSEKWVNFDELLLSPGDDFLLDLRLADEEPLGPNGEPNPGNGEEPFGPEPEYETRVGDIVRMGENDLTDVDPIAELEAAGYREGKNLFPFPYDWRKNSETAKGGGYLYFDGDVSKDMTLNQFVDYVRRETDAKQVDIMAHSLGGLVTLPALRDPAIRNPDGSSKVRKVLTLGTPVLGATEFYGFLQYRLDCFVAPLEVCLSNPETIQKTIGNFPALYQGIPGRNFHAAEGSPLVFDYDSDNDGARDGEKSYEYWTGLDGRPEDADNVAKSHNETLMRAGGEYHRKYDDPAATPFAAPVEYTRIVGDSLATTESFHKKLNQPNCTPSTEYSEGPCDYTEYEYEIIESGEDRFEGGDGTIPLHSADVYNPDRGFDMRRGYPNVYAHNVEHGNLATDEAVLGFATAYFSGERQPASSQTTQTSSPMGFFAMREANAQDTTQPPSDVARIAEQSGLSTTPESFDGIEVVTNGPVRGHLEDGSAKQLGDTAETPGNSAVEEIPGGDYNGIGDSRSFFLNDASGSYTANFQAVGGEEIEVKVRTFVAGRITEQAIYRLESPVGSVLKLNVTAGADVGAAELLVDADADDAVERRLSPASVVKGQAASEYDAPTTTLVSRALDPQTPRGPRDGGANGGRGRPRPEEALVTLSAEDGPGGSGVATTYYALPGDTELRVYGGPFRVPLGTVMRFGSVDKADNVEVLRRVLVDDTPSDRKTAEPMAPGGNVRRYVEHRGDEDWFAFEADGAALYRLHLHGLPADYDLTLYDASGDEVASSAERGKRSEEVRERLSAGRYYVKVSGFEGAWDADKPYALDLGAPGSGTAPGSGDQQRR